MKNGRFHQLLFFILTTILGMQAMRMFIALLLYILRDNLGQSANFAGILAFFVFATTFLISIMCQRFGLSHMWRYPALLLGPLLILVNILFSLITPARPAIIMLLPLLLTMLAVAAFLQFLPHYLLQQSHNLPLFIYGLLLGLAADTALHGAVLTYDFVWHNLIGLLLIFAAQLALLLLNSQPDGNGRSPSIRWPWAMLAFGPYLFLQMLLFQNIASVTALTGWSFGWAFTLVLLSHLIALITAVTLSQRQSTWANWLPFALLLILSSTGQWGGWLSAAQQLAGQISSAVLLSLILLRLGRQEQGADNSRTFSLAYGLGFLIYLSATFIYYIGYDIALPFPNTAVPPIPALILSLIAFLALSHKATTQAIPTAKLGLPLLLLLLPIYTLISHKTAVPTATTSPARIITYNLHNGFHPYGYMELEAMAQVIEQEQADIIILQEISRGWIINGSTDMLTWLSQRLNMPYIFGPTADPLWGNALLSRYPITDYQLIPLAPANIPLARGFIAADINIGNGQTLQIIATHLHHPTNGSQIRQQQIQAIVDYAQNRPRTIIAGDLNALPNTPEIEILRNAGFQDVLANSQPNFTYHALNPTIQIDYIWHTPDLTAESISLNPASASDHLAIAVTIR